MHAPLRLLLVDDSSEVRRTIRAVVQDLVGDMAECGDGTEVLARFEAFRPDLVLMDIRMPRLDGIAATRRVVAQRPDTRVLVLTTFDLDEYVYDALIAGASGFLLKDVGRDDLVAAVRVVAAGDALLAPGVTRRLLGDFVRSRTATAAPAPGAAPSPDRRAVAALASLTPRERDTLGLLARGLSNAEIAAELVVSDHTVKTHVGNVLMKLGLRDRIHAVIYAYEHDVVRPGST